MVNCRLLINSLVRRWLVTEVEKHRRPRVTYLVQEGDRYFELVDTEGIGDR